MRYSLVRERKKYGTAGSKAVRDTNQILHAIGYKPLPFDTISNNWFTHNLKRLYYVIKIFFTLNEEDVCFMQWPTYSSVDEKLLYPVLRRKCRHLHLLIHDLTSLRTGKNAEYESRFLNLAEIVIAHTEAMKGLLIEWGVSKEKIKVLTSFDYLISDRDVPQRHYSKEVVFAGNLAKSGFLRELASLSLEVSFFCYGKKVDGLGDPLLYKGEFDGDYVSGIEGSWGLVWDGDSINTCSGKLGEYLRINSPHKVSLYIVSRLPIIIWRKAALADYVQEHDLGIVVDSLKDIPAILDGISVEQYNAILQNLDRERELLTTGGHLQKVLG